MALPIYRVWTLLRRKEALGDGIKQQLSHGAAAEKTLAVPQAPSSCVTLPCRSSANHLSATARAGEDSKREQELWDRQLSLTELFQADLEAS